MVIFQTVPIARSGLAVLPLEAHRTTRRSAVNRSTEPALRVTCWSVETCQRAARLTGFLVWKSMVTSIRVS